jgi:hypothetical protein
MIIFMEYFINQPVDIGGINIIINNIVICRTEITMKRIAIVCF